MTKEVKDFNLYNYDNNFSVRIRLDNGNSVSCITDNIFSIDLPKIYMTNLVDNDALQAFRMSLRSTKDGSVENELYNILCRQTFDIEVSLTNPNKVDFTFNECSVSSIEFGQLAHKAKSNPFNFTVEVDYKYAKYFNGGEVFTFGDSPVDYKYAKYFNGGEEFTFGDSPVDLSDIVTENELPIGENTNV